MKKEESLKINIVNIENKPVVGAVVSIVNAPDSFVEIAAISDNEGNVQLPVTNTKGNYTISVFYDGISKTETFDVTDFETNKIVTLK